MPRTFNAAATSRTFTTPAARMASITGLTFCARRSASALMAASAATRTTRILKHLRRHYLFSEHAVSKEC
jgi:hypothetical protein